MATNDLTTRIVSVIILLILGGAPAYWLIRIAVRQGRTAPVGRIIPPLLLGTIIGTFTALFVVLYIVGTASP